MSEQDGTQANPWQWPSVDDALGWKIHWAQQGQNWRRKPEIDAEQQEYLTKLRFSRPDEQHGIYPFKGIKLSRAEVEWLLATLHKRGPVNWEDERKSGREGFDLRGADLQDLDLSKLPLAKCDLSEAQLQRANLHQTLLQGANLSNAQLQGAILVKAQLQQTNLTNTQLQRSSLFAAQLQEADLSVAQLQEANLTDAQLQGAILSAAQIQGANLREAQLLGATMNIVKLANADHIGPQFADVQWGDTNLAVVDWTQITILGDEYRAHQGNNSNSAGFKFRTATRAYRQLSVALRNQGLNEDAARFSFRAQRMQRKVFWYQRNIGQYLFSGFLNLLSGYGYRFWRSFFAYVFVIGVFATIYYHIGPHLAWYESIVISMTAFHGRGFFPTQFSPGDPQAIAAAIEALVGLFIEITLIATLTQRFFGK